MDAGYFLLVWATTTTSLTIGYILGKPWLDKRFNKTQMQKQEGQAK